MNKPNNPNTQTQVTENERETSFVPFGCTDKIRLTASMVRQFIAVPTRSGALPTERDCIRFIMLCRGKRANPFEGDCFMIGYDSQNGPSFSIVCGIELFLKRAEQNEQYDGCESGVIVTNDNGMTERQGSIVLKGETLIGGWARLKRKDRAMPFYKTATFSVYDTGKSRWQKDPAGMIEKVAKSQVLREAFPTALGGLYTQEEMQKVTEMGSGVITAHEPIEMPRAIEGSVNQPPQQSEPPPSESQQAPSDDAVKGIQRAEVLFDSVTVLQSKPGTAKPWMLWQCKFVTDSGSELICGTFSQTLADTFEPLLGQQCEITYRPGRKDGTLELCTLSPMMP